VIRQRVLTGSPKRTIFLPCERNRAITSEIIDKSVTLR
jgi:hypothetical protein